VSAPSAEDVSRADGEVSLIETEIAYGIEKRTLDGSELAALRGSLELAKAEQGRIHAEYDDQQAKEARAWADHESTEANLFQASAEREIREELASITAALSSFGDSLRMKEATRREHLKRLNSHGDSDRLRHSVTGIMVDGRPLRPLLNPALTDLLRALIPLLRLGDSHGPLADQLTQATRFVPGLPQTPKEVTP
jgi:hypothetical protein